MPALLELSGKNLYRRFLCRVEKGSLNPGAFSGSPKKATVVFGAPYPDTTYSVTIQAQTDGLRSYNLTVENKTVTGFTVNLNTSLLGHLITVDWQVASI